MQVKKRLKSFSYAFAGIKDLFKTQPNAQIHLFVALCVLIAGFFFNISTIEWCILSLTMALVLSAEGFNTAIEYLTDLVSPDHHPLAGKTKDVAAGAVLISAIAAVIVGLLIFLPKMIQLFNG